MVHRGAREEKAHKARQQEPRAARGKDLLLNPLDGGSTPAASQTAKRLRGALGTPLVPRWGRPGGTGRSLPSQACRGDDLAILDAC